MRANHAPSFIQHSPLLYGNAGRQKILHIHLTDKADPLAVFLLRIGEPKLTRFFSHFLFCHCAYREEHVCKVISGKRPEKISLVFLGIGAHE